MNSHQLETDINPQIQKIGMSFYFDSGTAEHAKAHDMNVYEYYAIGRGGVLGDVDASRVGEVFWFFDQGMIDMMWSGSTAKVDAVTGAQSHVKAAYAYADRVFANVDPATLSAFGAAARKVAESTPRGKYPLVDGYLAFDPPTEPAHAAKLGSIMLRELRGAVHIDSTRELGLSAADACYGNSEFIYKLHGYSAEVDPDRAEEIRSRMGAAEDQTTKVMAGYLDVLSDDEKAALKAGAEAMDEAIKNASGSN